jgi:peptidoglycan/LPS O-acetylase OafA/YrhL
MEDLSVAGTRIGTLDGWRGMAILLVLLEHLTYYGKHPVLVGSLGVDVFFVLSGYLITSRLVAEQDKTGRISLPRFYLRRVFRILPPVCAYVVAMIVLKWVVRTADVNGSQIAASLFFFRNYQYSAHPTGLLTAQFWSLAIEEHFYLFWPAVLVWFGRRKALVSAAVLAAASAAWRLALERNSTVAALVHCPTPAQAVIRTDARLDGLLVGCVLALLLRNEAVRRFIYRNFPRGAPAILLMGLYADLHRTHGFPALTTYLLLALMLASTLIVTEGLSYRALNLRPLVWIGSISYSIYIWQQVFLLHLPGDMPLGRLNVFPMDLVCVVGVAWASFHLLEGPSIRLGARLIRRQDESLKAVAKIPNDVMAAP